jgi:hypothetical protein
MTNECRQRIGAYITGSYMRPRIKRLTEDYDERLYDENQKMKKRLEET